jgi:hypothetical protein
MGIRHWLKRQMVGGDAGGDVPPGTSLMDTLFGRTREQRRSLGEYDAASYPRELRDTLDRRQEVADRILEMDITDPEARVEAIPTLRRLLRTYPHPLVYETLIHAYVEDGRFDEAKGLAWAARARREECMKSEHPEIRSEVDHLQVWSPEDVEAIRQERGGASSSSGGGSQETTSDPSVP